MGGGVAAGLKIETVVEVLDSSERRSENVSISMLVKATLEKATT